MRRPDFDLPYALAEAINLGSRARYPGAADDADSRVEAMRGRGTRNNVVAVHCGPAAAPLIIADIEKVMATADAELAATCAEAIRGIHAAIDAANRPLRASGEFRAQTGNL